MSIFSRGLTRALRPIANRRRENFTGPDCLRKFAEELNAYQDTHNALLRAQRPKMRDGRSSTAALVDADTGSRSIFRGPIRSARTDPIALVGADSDGHDTRGPGDTRTTSSSTESDPQYPPTRESTPQHLSTDPDSILLSQVAAAAHMGPDALRRNRPADGPPPQTAGRSLPTSSPDSRSALPLICYLCFFEGHMARECPFRGHATDPAYLAFFRANWEALPCWVQEYLKAQNRGYRYPRAQQGVRGGSRDPSPYGRPGQRPYAARPPPTQQVRPVVGNAAAVPTSVAMLNRNQTTPVLSRPPPATSANPEEMPAPVAVIPPSSQGPGK